MKMLKKRKVQHKFNTALDYLNREQPEFLQFVQTGWSSNKRILQKTFRKLTSYQGS
jgi:hypothetical protein